MVTSEFRSQSWSGSTTEDTELHEGTNPVGFPLGTSVSSVVNLVFFHQQPTAS
jgi:hypothetical protein